MSSSISYSLLLLHLRMCHVEVEHLRHSPASPLSSAPQRGRQLNRGQLRRRHTSSADDCPSVLNTSKGGQDIAVEERNRIQSELKYSIPQ